jgi:hypothetical protein
MCVRCTQTIRATLVADHKKGDGYVTRKPNKKTGMEDGWHRHYEALAAARNGTAQEIYQVLCQNCNVMKKGQNGENTPGYLRANGIPDPDDPQLELFPFVWEDVYKKFATQGGFEHDWENGTEPQTRPELGITQTHTTTELFGPQQPHAKTRQKRDPWPGGLGEGLPGAVCGRTKGW